MGCLGDSAGSIEPILVLSEVFVGDQEIDDAPAGIPSVKGRRFIFTGVVSGDAGAGSDENRTGRPVVTRAPGTPVSLAICGH